MVPDARILVGHGQMGEGELEDVMVKFIAHEADILVCTTIIECGLDIPNANTIIINNADRFGLQRTAPASRPRRAVEAPRVLLSASARRSPGDAGRSQAPQGDRGIFAPGRRFQDRHARPGNPRRGKHPRPRAIRPHRDGRLRDVLPVAGRSGAATQERSRSRSRPKRTSTSASRAFIPKTYIPGDRQRMDIYRRLTRCSDLEMLDGLEAGHGRRVRRSRRGR